MLYRFATLVLIGLPVVMVSIGVLFLLTACSIGEYSSRHSADAQSSLDSFETHVHPLFKTMRCNSCHFINETNPSHPPEFADEDIAIAHAAAEQRVNFNDIESSKFVTKQQNAHGCEKSSGECGENAAKLIIALTTWRASRDSSAEESLSFSDEKDADQDKTEANYANHELKFAITQLIDNIQGNVTLKVTASKNMTTKILTLKNFKISTTDKPIFLGGLLAKRNGMASTDRSKMRVCAIVKPVDDDKILTQFSEMVFALADGDSSPNMIAFGLNNLRVATDSDECDDDVPAQGN